MIFVNIHFEIREVGFHQIDSFQKHPMIHCRWVHRFIIDPSITIHCNTKSGRSRISRGVGTKPNGGGANLLFWPWKLREIKIKLDWEWGAPSFDPPLMKTNKKTKRYEDCRRSPKILWSCEIVFTPIDSPRSASQHASWIILFHGTMKLRNFPFRCNEFNHSMYPEYRNSNTRKMRIHNLHWGMRRYLETTTGSQ